MPDRPAGDRCPSLCDLVLASDGGLSPEHKAEITEHLSRCAECAEHLRQANASLEASADVLDDEKPSGAAVGNVANFRVKGERAGNARAVMPVSFEDEIGAEYDSHAKDVARNREFARRLHKQKQKLIHRPAPATAWVRQWLPAAAVIPLLILGLALSRLQTVVRAEELLTRATKHESSLPATRNNDLRVELKSGLALATTPAAAAHPVLQGVQPFVVSRNMVGGVVRDAGPGGVAASGSYYAVAAAVLSTHGFDPNQPLSLAGLQAWRSSPGDKRDEVIVRTDTYLLRTTASIGALRMVELTVRRHDYHVLKLTLGFDGAGSLEFSEVEEPIPSSIAVKAAPVAPVAPTMTAPVAMAAGPSSLASSAVDTSRSQMTSVGRAPVSQPALSRWLDRTFRASAERQTFVPTLQRLVMDVRQHLSELDTLAREYPEAEVGEQWDSADQAGLRRRVEDSYRRVSRDLNDLDLHISVLFGSRTRSFPVTEAPADWRRRTTDALAHAASMDAQVRDLLKLDDVPSPSGDARNTNGARVPATFAALWDVVHAPAGGHASRQ